MRSYLHHYGTRSIDRTRSLRIESLEDRRMLTTMADVVFLVDESGSAGSAIKNWLSANIADFDAELSSNDIDVRYGLVGYGQIPRFAHSHLVDTNEMSLPWRGLIVLAAGLVQRGDYELSAGRQRRLFGAASRHLFLPLSA